MLHFCLFYKKKYKNCVCVWVCACLCMHQRARACRHMHTCMHMHMCASYVYLCFKHLVNLHLYPNKIAWWPLSEATGSIHASSNVLSGASALDKTGGCRQCTCKLAAGHFTTMLSRTNYFCLSAASTHPSSQPTAAAPTSRLHDISVAFTPVSCKTHNKQVSPTILRSSCRKQPACWRK